MILKKLWDWLFAEDDLRETQLFRILEQLIEKEENQMNALQTLTAAVASTVAVQQKAIAAILELLAAVKDGVTPEQLAALEAQLVASNEALTAVLPVAPAPVEPVV